MTSLPHSYANKSKLIRYKLITTLENPQVYPAMINAFPNNKNMVTQYNFQSRSDQNEWSYYEQIM